MKLTGCVSRLAKRACWGRSRQLCDRARVTLSPKDKAFLERLTKFVEWRGRHPVPNQRPAENDVTMTTTQDLRRIEEIMKTLDDRYNS